MLQAAETAEVVDTVEASRVVEEVEAPKEIVAESLLGAWY